MKTQDTRRGNSGRTWLLWLPVFLVLGGCTHEEDERVGGMGFEGFVPQYNEYIANWVGKELRNAREELAGVEEERKGAGAGEGLEKEEGEVGLAVGNRRHGEALEKVARFERRAAGGDYFRFATLADLPGDLAWKDGLEQPELGDPAVIKGGTFRTTIADFPPTLRPFGPKANHSFRSSLYDDIEVALIDQHSITGEVMPGVAREWAMSGDGRSVYFKLHEDATYTDGEPVKAADFLVAVFIRVSNNVTEPYWKQYFREEFSQWTVYDDHTLGVTFPEPKPELGMFTLMANFAPAAPHFYTEYGPDYEERYQWRVPPTTGAYYVKPEDIVKGEAITLTRAEDWWGNDKKFYQYRYNADRIHYRVVRDENKARELFRAGELDYQMVSGPESWYEKTEIPPVFNGYIERYWWYNQFPRPPWGLYLNTAQPLLDEREVRVGLAYSMNWEKVLNIVFWGDYERLPGFVAGYGDLVNPAVKPREYSPRKAREAFAKAGFTKSGPDGILRRPDGTKLEMELNFRNDSPVMDRIMAILKEEARVVGVDILLSGETGQVGYKKQMEKKHYMGLSAWSVQPPFMEYYQYFHSSNAYDEKGNLKFETNNVFSYSDPEMDRLTKAGRNATTREEIKELGMKVQEKIHEEAIFIPGWMRDFERVACWRWMRWPDTEELTFCPPLTSYPDESYVWWIDPGMKEETLEAMAAGRTFPEVEVKIERYREKGGAGE